MNVGLKKLRNRLLQNTYRPGKSRLTSIKSLDAAIESDLNAIMGRKKKKSGKGGKNTDNKKDKEES